MIVATIDIGTNTALLLIADVRNGILTELHRERRTVRLGEGLDASGAVSGAALRRLREALVHYKAVIDNYRCERLVVTGTSASRDASNKDELRRVVQESVDTELKIIRGEDEASLAFVASVVALDGLATVIDIGGGSTELVHGTLENGAAIIERTESYDIGSVRLAERFADGQPMSGMALQRMEAAIADVVSDVRPYPSGTTLVGSGGTATTAALLINELDRMPDDKARLVVSVHEIAKLYDQLAGLSYDQVYAIAPDLMEGRADVLPTGLCILKQTMRHLGFDELVVSFRGLRHGVALKVAASEGNGTLEL